MAAETPAGHKTRWTLVSDLSWIPNQGKKAAKKRSMELISGQLDNASELQLNRLGKRPVGIILKGVVSWKNSSQQRCVSDREPHGFHSLDV